MNLLTKIMILGFLAFFVPLWAVWAQDVQKEFYGEINTTYTNNTEEDSAGKSTYFDMTSDALLGFKVKQDYGNWKTTAKMDFEIESFDVAKFHPKNVYITMEDEVIKGIFGRHDPSGTTVGNKYLDVLDKSFEIGNTFGRGDYLELQFKQFNVNFVVGQNGGSADRKQGTEEQVMAVFYSTKVKNLPVKMSYTNMVEKPDPRRAPADTEFDHGEEDYNAVAFGFGIPVGKFQLSLNYDQLENTFKDSDKNNRVVTRNVVVFDYDVNDAGFGLTLIYSAENWKEDTMEPITDTRIDFGVAYPRGPVNLFGGYNSKTLKDEGSGTEIKSSRYGLGVTYAF